MIKSTSSPLFKSRLKHTFHLVDSSPLPIFTANLIGALALQLVYYFQGYRSIYLTLLVTFFFSIPTTSPTRRINTSSFAVFSSSSAR